MQTSFRMEALGMLAGIKYLREELNWQGKVKWHLDNEAVVNLYPDIQHKKGMTWIKMVDRDIWTLICKEKRWWKNRLAIKWVKGHADLLNRENTEEEKQNQTADEIADWGDEDPDCETKLKQETHWFNVKIHGEEIRGRIRAAILGQIKIDRTKRETKDRDEIWGVFKEDIEWKYMIYSRTNQTQSKKRNILKDTWNLRGTLDLLKEWQYTENDECRVCDSGIVETHEHHLLHCEDEKIKGMKNGIWNIMWEELDKRGEPWLPELIGLILFGQEEKIPSTRIKEDLPKSWQCSYDKNVNEKSNQEHAESMAVELILNLYHTQPIWKGILTTPMIRILTLGGIKPSEMKRTLKHYNDCLLVIREELWTHRNERTYAPEKEQEDMAYRKTVKRRTTGTKHIKKRKINEIIKYLTRTTKDQSVDEHQSTNRTTIADIIPEKTKRTKCVSIMSKFDRIRKKTTIQRWRTLTTGILNKEQQKKQCCQSKKRNRNDKQNNEQPIYTYMMMQSPEKRTKRLEPPTKRNTKSSRSRNVKELEREKAEIEERMEARDDLHENSCYKCKEGGRLVMCEGCKRSAHENCISGTIGQYWTCGDCQHQKNTLTIELERITKRIELSDKWDEWVEQHNRLCKTCTTRVEHAGLYCASCRTTAHPDCVQSNITSIWQCEECHTQKKAIAQIAKEWHTTELHMSHNAEETIDWDNAIKEGIQSKKQTNQTPWHQVKKDLGIKTQTIIGDGLCLYRALAKTQKQTTSEILQCIIAMARQNLDKMDLSAQETKELTLIIEKTKGYTDVEDEKEYKASVPRSHWGGHQECELYASKANITVIWVHAGESYLTIFKEQPDRPLTQIRYYYKTAEDIRQKLHELNNPAMLLYDGVHFNALRIQPQSLDNGFRKGDRIKILSTRFGMQFAKDQPKFQYGTVMVSKGNQCKIKYNEWDPELWSSQDHLELLYNAGNKFRVEFFVKQGKRNNRKTAKKHLPKRKNEAKSSQGKEAIAVETDREYVIMRGAITPKEKYKKDRCKDVIGLTLSKALNTTVENDGGKQVVYTKMDLSNDQKDGFITLTKNRELTTTGQGAYGEPIRNNTTTNKETARNTNQGSKHKKNHRLATTDKDTNKEIESQAMTKRQKTQNEKSPKEDHKPKPTTKHAAEPDKGCPYKTQETQETQMGTHSDISRKRPIDQKKRDHKKQKRNPEIVHKSRENTRKRNAKNMDNDEHSQQINSKRRKVESRETQTPK